MLSSLLITFIWTFNLVAILFAREPELLRRAVLAAKPLLLALLAAEVGWVCWLLLDGPSPALATAAVFLGLSLFVGLRAVVRCGAKLQTNQVVTLCAWWVSLGAMAVHAMVLGRVTTV